MNIYSKIQPTQIIHIINRKADIKPGRVDMVDADQYIQCAAMKMEQGKTFKAHKHVSNRMMDTDWRITQESWVVISGCVKVMLYDLDDTLLHEDVLEAGDCSITLEGGHNYMIMQDAIVYEFKTGPYLGQENDKTFI